jgi:hypothetical protein
MDKYYAQKERAKEIEKEMAFIFDPVKYKEMVKSEKEFSRLVKESLCRAK